MRVLLVNLPFFRFLGLEQNYVPLSLLAVGSQMVADGHTVRLKNLELDSASTYLGYAGRAAGYAAYLARVANWHSDPVWLELQSTIHEFQPEWLGTSVLNIKHRAFRSLCAIASQRHLPVLAGGPHVTLEPQAYESSGIANQLSVAPYAIAGEYEAAHRGCSRIADLDALPMPDYRILDESDRYIYTGDSYAHLVTSRGCPYRCRFCSSAALWHRRVTYKSATRILQEMVRIERGCHPRCFTFWDEVFTLNKQRLREFCSRYTLASHWRCDTRADSLDADTVKMMASAGCQQMSIGIESGSDRILAYIGKGETTQDFIRAAELLAQHGIEWKAYCIIGFPDETAEEMRRTLDFARQLKPARITLSYFTPYRGTDLYEECARLGLLQEGLGDCYHQGPRNYFSHRISEDEYAALRQEISEAVDTYNHTALQHWV